MRFFVCILHFGIFSTNSGASNVGSVFSVPFIKKVVKTPETITIPEMTRTMFDYGTQLGGTRLKGLVCYRVDSDDIKILSEKYDKDIFMKYEAFLRSRIKSVMSSNGQLAFSTAVDCCLFFPRMIEYLSG